ncbi:MAG: hypothetical protein M0P39_02690 [Rhodocyclaceae bacterium]|jgi:chromosome segregation ATPase|nr:hypothetical protein [Rhodocyclaceae bacterium]
MLKSLTAILLATLLLSAPAAYAARSFCCVDDQGARYCSDVLPEKCRTRAYTEFNERGVKVRNVEAPLTEAQQAVRDAELKKQREADRLAQEQKRRDVALMTTYATEQDLDVARDRQVKEVERSIVQAQDKLAAAQKAKLKLGKDKEFYKNNALPEDLKDSIKRNEADIQAHGAAVEAKKKEIEDIKGRFETDRQRLRELRNEKDKAP